MSVFHLKYRPKMVEDIDLTDVFVKIKKLLVLEDMPQSLLLSGPKGAGKTSAARIIARSVNCLKSKEGQACGGCENCKEIDKGASMDVIEIDAASNRGIDDIRNLKESSYLLPSKLKKKVFIIDEVHMLTKEAFNALLKVIEEPPKHVMFILCTTDFEKIPETILSRLIKIDFKKGSREELLKSLERVIEGEQLKLDQEVAELIVKNSDGSFRNLQKYLNELVMEFGKEIKMSDLKKYVENKLGDYDGEKIDQDLAIADIKKIVKNIENMAKNGIDLSQVRDIWLNYFQNKMINEALGERVTSGLSGQELTTWIRKLIEAGEWEKKTSIDQLPLELAVIEFLENKSVKKEEIKIKEIEIKKTEIKIETNNEQEKETEEREGVAEVVGVFNGGIDTSLIEECWGRLLTTVKPHNHSVEAFLRASRPKKVKGNTLVLDVFYPFHKDKLEEPKNREIVEECLSQVLGKKFKVECLLSTDKKKPLIIKNDTPMNQIVSSSDIYEVAKDIFG